MNYINAIILSTLFIPYVFGFLVEADIMRSDVTSLDKIVRLGILYVSSIVLLMNMALSRTYIPRGFGRYFWASVFIFVVLILHYALYGGEDLYVLRAEKELVRVGALIVVFLLCAIVTMRRDQIRLLVKLLAIMGVFVSVLALWHSMTGESVFSRRYIGGYLRAGSEIVDPNLLGAFINLTSLACIAGYFTTSRSSEKMLFLAGFLVTQAGRFFTFSTGSFLNVVIALTASFYLVWRYDNANFRSYAKIVIMVVAVLAVAIFGAGMFETLFYRLRFSDEYVLQSSVYSRLQQHMDYVAVVKEHPFSLLFGYGTAKLPTMLRGVPLHNSYLRALAIGGVGVFACFMFLVVYCIKDFHSAIKIGDDYTRVVSIFFLAAFIGWSFQAATVPGVTLINQWFFFIVAYSLRKSAAESSLERPAL